MCMSATVHCLTVYFMCGSIAREECRTKSISHRIQRIHCCTYLLCAHAFLIASCIPFGCINNKSQFQFLFVHFLFFFGLNEIVLT